MPVTVEVDAAARPLLAAASVVLVAGVVAALVSERSDLVTTRPASAAVAAPVADAMVGPPTTSRPVTVVLGAAVPTTALLPVAPPTTTARRPVDPGAPVVTTTTTAITSPTTAPSPTPNPTTTAPPAPPTTTAPPPSAAVDTGCEQYLVDRTNAARSEQGLAPLAWDSRPHGIARDWSAHLLEIGRLEHNRRYGEQLTAAGVPWTTAGENLGRGDAARMFDLWMESSTHRPNILSTAFTSFAVACISDGTEMWVTQDFFG